MPKISVIIPVYNTEKYLRQCLDSVVNQTLNDIEIICVDDGSTDGSLKILEEYALKDNRIKILKQKNKFAGVARNNGLVVATGQYIHFLDSDDWIEEDSYEKLYKIISENNVDFVKFCGQTYDNHTGEIGKAKCKYMAMQRFREKYFNSIFDPASDFSNCFAIMDSAWSGMYKREFLEKNNICFDNLKCANDVGFFYRCILKADKIYISSQKLLYYRINRDNSLVSIRPQNFECQIALYPIVKNICKDIPDENKRKIAINAIIKATFIWYYMIIKNKAVKLNIKLKIKKQIRNFINLIKDEELDEYNLSKIKNIKKEFVYGIFSVRNVKNHKVLTILGIKIKLKRK